MTLYLDHTRSTLPQAFFPKNRAELAARRERLDKIHSNILIYGLLVDLPIIIVIGAISIVSLYTHLSPLPLAFSSVGIMSGAGAFLLIPIFLYFGKEIIQLRIAIKKDRKEQLTSADARQIYMHEENQLKPFEELLGNELKLNNKSKFFGES